MQKGLVSVVIPCYNGEKYLERCFQALLSQTYKSIEVIIVDDGSTDNTSEIIDKYIKVFADKKMILKKIRQENGGIAAAVNTGLKLVEGEYLVWQDCDDLYEKDAFLNMKKFLEENREFDFVRGQVAKIDEKTNNVVYIGKSKYPSESKIFDFFVFETDSYCFPGVFMARMKFFDQCIKDREIYISMAGQNYQLILPLAYNGKCGYLDKIVYNYYIIESSHSHSVKKTRDLFRRCDQHKDILFHVIKDLNMSKGERLKYYIKINIKYIKKKIKIILSKMKELVRKIR